MRRRVALVLLVLAIAILWRPFVRPLGAGAILVTDIYSSALWQRNVAAYVTPPPRVEDGSEPVGASDMRVTWWIPGWGSLHPAVMLVNGATEKGNDDPETRRLGEALARAGYLVMLPEFTFLKAGRLEREATSILDAAFARAIARPETRGMTVGAFGFSVGGGMLLAAREGVFKVTRQDSGWATRQLVGPAPGQTNFAGAGEIRAEPVAARFTLGIDALHGPAGKILHISS